jgi:hypothetical protein
MMPSYGRLLKVLTMIFDTAKEVRDERIAAGMDAESAKVLLLFDGIEDIIGDACLVSHGGMSIVRHWETKLVTACVDTNDCYAHAVFTSSSAALSNVLNLLSDVTRCADYELAGPDESAVLDKLQARGYTKEEAEELVGVLGTCPRMLGGPLKRGAARVKAGSYIVNNLTRAVGELRHLQMGLSAEDAAAVKAALNALAVGPVPAANLPESIRRHALFGNVFYLQLDGRVGFQDKAVQSAWAELRKEESGGSWLRVFDANAKTS